MGHTSKLTSAGKWALFGSAIRYFDVRITDISLRCLCFLLLFSLFFQVGVTFWAWNVQMTGDACPQFMTLSALFCYRKYLCIHVSWQNACKSCWAG